MSGRRPLVAVSSRSSAFHHSLLTTHQAQIAHLGYNLLSVRSRWLDVEHREGTETDLLKMVYRPLRYEQMMRAAEAYDVRARRMFGGMGVYTGEKMFAFLVGEDIGLKLSPDDLQEAMKLPGAGPLKPDPDAEPMREYVKMPREVLDNLESFTYWVERSAAYARSKIVH